MSLVVLEPVDITHIGELAKPIRDHLNTYRPALIGARAAAPINSQTHAMLQATINDELAELIAEAREVGNHHVFHIMLERNRRSRVGHLWYRHQHETRGLGEAFLLWLQIEEPHRGMGYATAALQTLMEKLRGQGVASLGVEVYASNRPARVLYEKVGLTVAREVRICALSKEA